MRSSCVSYPEHEPLLLIRKSQLRICDGDHCAAALLSFFEHWHNVKLAQQGQAAHANRVAEQHGEEGMQDMTLLVYQTEEGLERGLLGLYGRSTIRKSLRLLLTKGFLTIHTNPNPRYRFDKTHYFQFHPDKVSAQLLENPDPVKVTGRDDAAHETYETQESSQPLDVADTVKVPCRENAYIEDDEAQKSPQAIDSSDQVEITDRSGNFTASSVKNNASCVKNNAPIAEITSEISEKEIPPIYPPPGEAGTKSTSARPPKQRPSKFVPEAFVLTPAMREWAQQETPGVNVESETAKMRDWEFKTPHSDWERAWRNWMRTAWERLPPEHRTATPPARRKRVVL